MMKGRTEAGGFGNTEEALSVEFWVGGEWKRVAGGGTIEDTEGWSVGGDRGC
jgi:hypothetical protein